MAVGKRRQESSGKAKTGSKPESGRRATVHEFPTRRARRQPEPKTPMERPAQPEEIAPAFVFFASEVESSYITGEVLSLLGGETTAA